MDFLELGADTLPILFMLLAGIVVTMAKRLNTQLTSHAEDQKEYIEEIATLKDAIRGCGFRVKQLKLALKREASRADRTAMLAKYYKAKYVASTQPSTTGSA